MSTNRGKPVVIKALSDMHIDEVSLVDVGANQHAEVMIAKRDLISKDNPDPGSMHLNRPLGRVGEGPRMNGKGKKTDHAEVSEDESCEPDQDVDDGDVDELGHNLDSAPVEDKGTTVAGVKAKKVKKGFWTDLVSKVLAEEQEFATPSPTDITIPFEKHFTAQGADPSQQNPGMSSPPDPSQGQAPFAHPGLMSPQPTGAPQGAAQPGQMPGQAGQVPGQMPAGPLAEPQPQMAQLPPEVVEYIAALEDMVAQLQGGDDQQQEGFTQNDEGPTTSSDTYGSDNNGGKKMGGFGKSESYDPDEREFLVNLAKSLDDSEQDEQIAKAYELVEKAEQRAAAAEEIAKSERDIRLTQEWVAKAGRYDVPVAPSDLGPVLKRLSEAVTTDDFAVIEKCLGSASAQQGIFAEFGKRGTGSNGDVFEQVEQQKAELVSKGVSAAEAEAQVYELNPHLYDEYLRSQDR